MKGVLGWWEARCALRRPTLRFVDLNLRGVGQVMFQDNPLTGLLFFIAIGWGSYAADAAADRHRRARGAGDRVGHGPFGCASTRRICARACMASTPISSASPSPPSWRPLAATWICVLLGGAVSVVAMHAIANACKTWSLPALTAPFVLVAWLLLLATHVFANLEGALPTSSIVAPIDPAYADPLRPADFLQGMLQSISQVFLKGDGIAAILLLAGLAVSSLSSAAWALAGALIAVVTAHLFGAESDLVTGGLMGFSPVLTAIALGAVFRTPGLRGTDLCHRGHGVHGAGPGCAQRDRHALCHTHAHRFVRAGDVGYYYRGGPRPAEAASIDSARRDGLARTSRRHPARAPADPVTARSASR